VSCSAYGCEAALRRVVPTATIAAPSNASSHAGKPVNGSSPGCLGRPSESSTCP
jgi:hypothetical protein